MITDVATGNIRAGQIDTAYTTSLNIATGAAGAHSAALETVKN
jgi:hypothetical protein